MGELTQRRNRRAPVVPMLPEAEREALSTWMNERIRMIEESAEERIQLLRTVGEHPSPIFSQMVKKFGYLGIKKNLVAKIMGITTHTLAMHYLTDYELGEAEMVGPVAT